MARSGHAKWLMPSLRLKPMPDRSLHWRRWPLPRR